MHKSLAQPWFRPFGQPVDRRMLPSFRLHREALSKLVDRSVKERPEIWFMREDGSNLDENVDDIVSVVLTDGLDLLDQFHDPQVVLELIDSGWLLDRVIATRRRRCERRSHAYLGSTHPERLISRS